MLISYRELTHNPKDQLKLLFVQRHNLVEICLKYVDQGAFHSWR